MYKVLVIGCGSIGKRHIKNLNLLDKDIVIMAYDIDERKLSEVKRISNNFKVDNDIKKLFKEKPDIAFICTPPSSHIKYALLSAKIGCDLFIEKPLSNNLKDIEKLLRIIKEKKLITFVGCNMRFYWAITKIKDLLDKGIIGKVFSSRIEFGQYLPDWHPDEDYTKMYSSSKILGGGVILDAIHEIDYAMWFFGEVEDITSMYGKVSKLDIETEDVAEILIKFKENIIVSIHMDYLQRKYSRSCKIIGEQGTISWNKEEHSIKLYRNRSEEVEIFSQPHNYDDMNQMYVDEIQYFFNCVAGRQLTFNSVLNGFGVLKTALDAKKKGFYVK